MGTPQEKPIIKPHPLAAEDLFEDTPKPNLNLEKGPQNSIEAIKKKFQRVIDGREKQYDQDIEANPKMEAMRTNLEVHNGIVLGYAAELIDNMDLSEEERVAAIIATIEHDSGKLASALLDHHAQGVKYASKRLDILMGENFDGVEINPKIKQKVLEAIERHMNHPFLVMLNKGERFPEPQDDVDRVVFDADMLANAGFKNVAFRLSSETFLGQDIAKALKNGTSPLKESFENVMQGVRAIPQTVLLEQAQGIASEVVIAVDQIMEYFEENKIFTLIEEEFSNSQGRFDMITIAVKGGLPIIKKRINEEILKAGSKLNIDPKYLENFQI